MCFWYFEPSVFWLTIISFFSFQLPLIVPIVFIIICAFLVIVPCYVAPYEVGMGVLITAIGIPVYLVGVVWRNKPEWLNSAIRKFFFWSNWWFDFSKIGILFYSQDQLHFHVKDYLCRPKRSRTNMVASYLPIFFT